MAIGLSDISGIEWLGPVNSSPATDRMTSNEIFRANHVFGAENFHARIMYWRNQSYNGLVGSKLFAQDVYLAGFTFAKTSVVCNRC